MYGIEPSHNEEMRERQGMRLILEEKILEVLEVFFLAISNLCDLGSYIVESFKSLKRFVFGNKIYTFTILFALLALCGMLF